MTGDRPGARFEEAAARLDRWYAEHPDLASAEARVIQAVDPGGRALEVGVGTGVLGEALDVDVGLDPAQAPLERARERGIPPVLGVGEALPFADGVFRRVLVLTTLCFLDDPEAALAEARRVLEPQGALVAAEIPRDSAWGRRYQAKAEAGEGLYAGLDLRSVDETEALLEATGFTVEERMGTLRRGPGDEGGEGLEPPAADVAGCGYVAWRARP